MPKYDKAVLAEHIPAYAYISFVHTNSTSQDEVIEPAMFLRLLDFNEPALTKYLENGEIESSIHYWNTIGSLDVLDKVATIACSSNPQIKAESSPTGHWSKNFATLSIHRRKDWSVAAKGFNRYTWDFENSAKENVYGVFHSHGSLQISNSEADLKTYDVDEGWDWTRIPGATTVNMELDNIRTDKARYYNPGGFAGGVSSIGSGGSQPQNGAFGMVFKKPNYDMKSNKASPLNKMKFEFKKSYFFYEDLIVCIGSDIKVTDVDEDEYYAQTTIFQDKLVDPSQPSTISINGKYHDLRVLLKDRTHWPADQIAILEDSNKNTYKVSNPQAGFHIKISDQDSKEHEGCEETKSRYATAWLEHKKAKLASGDSYVYAIVVKGGSTNLLRKYKVIMKRKHAHVVRFRSLPGLGRNKIYGYSIFVGDTQIRNNGPVTEASAPCMIMVEKGPNVLYLAISNPSINFKNDPVMQFKETCTRKDPNEIPEFLKPNMSDQVGTKLMFCVESEESRIVVTLDVEVKDIANVKVDGKIMTGTVIYASKHETDEKKVVFSNLLNGFTTEVEITF
jgi:hypothetical protein